MPGCERRNLAMKGTRRLSSVWGVDPTRSSPVTPVVNARPRSTSDSASLSSARARRSSSSPSAVSWTRRPTLSKSRIPSSCSRSRICRPSAGCAPPHNHGTWAVVAGVDGLEKNVFWKRVDDGSRPGYAEIVKAGEKVFGAGDVVTFLPESICRNRSTALQTTRTRSPCHCTSTANM
jgi:hypothetical protein